MTRKIINGTRVNVTDDLGIQYNCTNCVLLKNGNTRRYYKCKMVRLTNGIMLPKSNKFKKHNVSFTECWGTMSRIYSGDGVMIAQSNGNPHSVCRDAYIIPDRTCGNGKGDGIMSLIPTGDSTMDAVAVTSIECGTSTIISGAEYDDQTSETAINHCLLINDKYFEASRILHHDPDYLDPNTGKIVGILKIDETSFDIKKTFTTSH